VRYGKPDLWQKIGENRCNAYRGRLFMNDVHK
jgi:hypothetical protein